jgi:hypothetical protein
MLSVETDRVIVSRRSIRRHQTDSKLMNFPPKWMFIFHTSNGTELLFLVHAFQCVAHFGFVTSCLVRSRSWLCDQWCRDRACYRLPDGQPISGAEVIAAESHWGGQDGGLVWDKQ